MIGATLYDMHCRFLPVTRRQSHLSRSAPLLPSWSAPPGTAQSKCGTSTTAPAAGRRYDSAAMVRYATLSFVCLPGVFSGTKELSSQLLPFCQRSIYHITCVSYAETGSTPPPYIPGFHTTLLVTPVCYSDWL